MKIRKLIRILHRDLGYLFFGMSIIYGISGLTLNHIRDFNPNYQIKRYEITLSEPATRAEIDAQWVKDLLTDLDMKGEYKKYYFPRPDLLKVFLQHGSLEVNLTSSIGTIETIRKRPLFFQVNFLHYNPGVWWKWFSDLFCVAWIIISVTGLFLIRSGKHSISKLGGIYTAIGIIVPLILLLLYL